MNITIRFGAANEISKSVPHGTTVGTILNDPNIRNVLGFGGNVQAVVDGQIQNNSSPLSDGDVVTVETRANTKASSK